MPRIVVYTTSPFLRLARRYTIYDCNMREIAYFEEYFTQNYIVARLRELATGRFISLTDKTFYIYCLDTGDLTILPYNVYRINLQQNGWTMYYYTHHKCRNFVITLAPCHRDIQKRVVVDTIECELQHPSSGAYQGDIAWDIIEDRIEREIPFTSMIYIISAKRYAKIKYIRDRLGNLYDYVYIYFKGTLEYHGSETDLSVDYLIPHFFRDNELEDDILNECEEYSCCYDTCENALGCYDDKYSDEAWKKIKNSLKRYGEENPSPRTKTSIFLIEDVLEILHRAFRNRELLFSLDEIVKLEAHISTKYSDYDYDLTEYLRDELIKNGWI